MDKKLAVLITCLLLGCFVGSRPLAAQAEVVVAQARNPELKQLFEEGRRLVDAGDYNGAIAIYQQAARLDPRNARIHSGMGYLYAQQGNFSLALTAYRRAIAIEPNNSDFYYAVGYIKGNMGDTNGAKEAYRRAIQINRGHVNAYLGLGVTQATLGDYEAAMWAYEQAINLDRNNARTYELMGSMFKQRRQSRQASNVLQKARDLYLRGNDQEGVDRVEAMLRDIGG
ncbi:TPR repeat-containing protein [Richelia sinica FACHB-800]|uniref:TPR repeat-containing protein n=1 Tax=Richelia sinica FACHB-800 TaxID=1357546 RepID=A0A975T734_9NOST|nr:tetratricopeptide repeat protein [Richelia sinica]MBD2663765.1 tetratricopeptide repeat protein [Richelia sinica FACHB-800]QXE22658.1 TPR repeat-containing protein [Richelia sinica FACHB-800]